MKFLNFGEFVIRKCSIEYTVEGIRNRKIRNCFFVLSNNVANGLLVRVAQFYTRILIFFFARTLKDFAPRNFFFLLFSCFFFPRSAFSYTIGYSMVVVLSSLQRVFVVFRNRSSPTAIAINLVIMCVCYSRFDYVAGSGVVHV